MGRLTLNGATYRLGGTQNLTNGSRERLCVRLVAHLAGNSDNVIQSQVSTVLDILLLLAITGGLL